MKRSTTKRALISSVLALVMCFGMLTGTTFAWFTDTVTSGTNIIAAGNLDVELYHSDSKVTDEVVGSSTTLFDDVDSDLWEPGAMAYEILTVANKGSLALKYQLTLNALNATVVDGTSFASMLKVAVVKDTNYTYGRDTIVADTNLVWNDLETFTLDGDLESTEKDVYGIIIWWQPSDNDNLFNMNNENQGKTVSVDVGVVLNATQLSSESDAFGPDYDKDSIYPGNSAPSNLGTEKITLVTEGEQPAIVVLPAELVSAIDDGTVTSVALNTSKAVVNDDGNGNVSIIYNTFEVVDQDGNEIDLSANTTAISVKIYVGTTYAGKNATIAHDGTLIANATVDADGYVTYNTTHFCEISIVIADEAPEAGMEDVKNEEAEDLTKLVQVLVGNHYYTVSQGMANSWKTLSNAEQIVADIYVPEDLIAYAMMYNNGDITANTGVHTDLTLKNNLDYANYNWVPIGRFYTNIHGEDKTISNINDSFLGCVYDCQIENLTLENVTASGSAAGVVGKELAGDMYISNLTIAGKNTVTYVKDNATNWPEEGTGVGAICGISLIGCGGHGNVEITVAGTITVNYNEVFFGNNTNLENLGVSKEFGLNVYKANANANVTVADGGAITTNGQGYLFDVADLEDGFAQDKLSKNYYVFSAAGLAAFAADVNAGNTYAGKTVVLYNDVDLENKEWTPIGNDKAPFNGNFEGNNKTVSNLLITGNNSSVGFFGRTNNGEIRNLTVNNAKVAGYLNVAVVSGHPYTAKYTNIKVTGHVEVNGFAYVGGVGGKDAYANWTNITVDADDTSYVKAISVSGETAYRTYVGGVVGFNGEGGHSFTNITSNIDVIGSTIDVGGAFGIAHYGNNFENVKVSGNVTITDATEAGDAEEMGGIAGVWNNGGANVTFNNCKFTGTLTANITEGVDLSNNTITGKAYSESGSGKLFFDNKEVVFLEAAEGKSVYETLGSILAEDANSYVVMTEDVKGESATTAPYGNKYGVALNGGTLDGNGNELYVECYGDDYGVMTTGGTVKNLTIKEGCRAIMIMSPTTDVILDNVNIGGDGVLYPINTGEHATVAGVDLIVTNSTLAGWTSYAGIESASFTNVKFEQGTYYNNIYGRVLKPYVNTTLTDCSFVEHMNLDLSGLAEGQKITFENCTVNGVAVTADVFTVPTTDSQYDTELFTVDLPSWATSISDCIEIK